MDNPGTIFSFDPDGGTSFAVDAERRTISGLALPYGIAAHSNGQKFQFSQGSLSWGDVGRIKLLLQHDMSQAVGRAIELDDRPDGLYAKFQIARGPEGDRALALAEDGVYDGLSIKTHPYDADFSQDATGVWHPKPGTRLLEISLLPIPAFDGARVSAVVAEADKERKTVMPEATEATAPQFDMDALATLVAEKMKPAAPTGPEVIPSTGGAVSFEVSEPDPYVFDKRGVLQQGAFDFSTDLFRGLKKGDHEAQARVLKFMSAQFDVDTADVNEVNPTGQRPDLYVDQKKFTYPLWEATRKGTLSDNTPFIIPKWSSSSGLVAAHTEGTEPTPGTFVTTGQTVTPTGLSGKVEITREVYDAGGNPNVSNLIWNKMQVAYWEAVEAAIQAVLVAANASITNIDLTTGAVDAALAGEIGAAIAALQFVRGGFTFDTLVLQVDLFKALAAAVDGNDRPLFPIYGPSNSNGLARKAYSTLDVFGLEGIPGPFLEPTGTDTEESWLFDRKDIFVAASPPQELRFQSLVEQVEIGIWGYFAGAVTDATGVREIQYDPAA